MIKTLDYTTHSKIEAEIRISGSKSESNRALILQKLFPNLTIENLSDSDDTHHLQNALSSEKETIDIGHAGTAMRFLTAFFASIEGKTTILTGSERMQERPIQILVDALRELGADIEYVNREGYPPLKITGKKLTQTKVSLDANISSQYISALLLMAPSLENGLQITLKGHLTSLPYIQMTLALLQQIGVQTSFIDQIIEVQPLKNSSQIIHIEPDWSSASYFYSWVALHANSSIFLQGFKANSLQGDHVVAEIYKSFGVETIFSNAGILIQKNSKESSVDPYDSSIVLNLNQAPDIAQTIAVTCLGLGIKTQLTGLHTLKIKETDRLTALKTELEKLGAKVEITEDSLTLITPKSLNQNTIVATYNDHRMAMAFAPLSSIIPLQIENPEVVTKSYKMFWEDLNKLIC